MKKIAILTSGGDAPGMNNAVRSIVKTALAKGMEPYLVYEGYYGLHSGNIKLATEVNVDQYIAKGGTFIYSARFPEFKNPKIRLEAKKQLDNLGIEALVVIGGDGSYYGAQLLHEIGVKTMGLPGTIDNDITSSEFTIGFDTALNSIVENVDRIRDTMESHNRAAVVEVMGHGSGDLALFAGLATGAEVVVTSENIKSPKEIASIVKKQIKEMGKRSVIIIVSELIYDNLDKLSKTIEEFSGVVTRGMSLSHLQRGGVPTAMERVNSSLMGIKAVEYLIKGESGLAIGILNGKFTGTPILEALALPREDRHKFANIVNDLNQS
ncbi:MAG: 6-phosphofructokinase [Mollicutes bacterium PWAP]|nr:6-phosphofructokinase [Mollicutes bacterium PWAP]